MGPLGVSTSGAADPISLRLGNRLVGNAEGAAGLEMTLLADVCVSGGRLCCPEWSRLRRNTGWKAGRVVDVI